MQGVVAGAPHDAVAGEHRPGAPGRERAELRGGRRGCDHEEHRGERKPRERAGARGVAVESHRGGILGAR